MSSSAARKHNCRIGASGASCGREQGSGSDLQFAVDELHPGQPATAGAAAVFLETRPLVTGCRLVCSWQPHGDARLHRPLKRAFRGQSRVYRRASLLAGEAALVGDQQAAPSTSMLRVNTIALTISPVRRAVPDPLA